MPIYEIQAERLNKIRQISFGEAGVKEKADLQRLLKNQVEIIAPDVLIIAEEFGEFDDSKRRIDLLGLDKQANIVVIELKRTEDGGHMELQALRYASMVSTLTFERTVEIFSAYLEDNNQQKDAEQEILEFLEWDERSEDLFAQDVRIVLASAEFSKEITSTVLWLNTYGLDIRCIRLRPYNDNGRILLDIEQVIPLPEASQYQIQVSAKSNQERKARLSTRDTNKYDINVYGLSFSQQAKRNAMYQVVKALCNKGGTPTQIARLIHWKAKTIFFEVEGRLMAQDFVQKASNIKGKSFDPRDWFCDDDQLFYSDGKTFAFTKRWGNRWAEALRVLAKAYPDANIEFSVSQEE
jgi:hypothetical protein